MAAVTLFHGSVKTIPEPDTKSGNVHNDYGRGFYCTELIDMAREWACKSGTDGFVNEYLLDYSGLKVLNLSDGKHNVLNWIALLLKNRTFSVDSAVALNARKYIYDHFLIDTASYDVIIGYRADDSYFRYAESFISNTLSVRSLNKALHLGSLGIQTVLVSEKALSQLHYISSEVVTGDEYYPRFIERDWAARQLYTYEIIKESNIKEEIFVMDIIREGMDNHDPRLQRIVSE